MQAASAVGVIQPPLVEPRLSHSKEPVRAGAEGDAERCQTPDAPELEDDGTEENIYYNLRRATPLPIRKDQLGSRTANSECVYADVSIISSPLSLQPQPLSALVPEQPTYTQHVSCSTLIPRYQRQSPVRNYIQTQYSAQTQLVDDMQETEEAIGSSSLIAPTEVPGSFKHRLAEIICKDLAKFQPAAPPSGSGSSASSQY